LKRLFRRLGHELAHSLFGQIGLDQHGDGDDHDENGGKDDDADFQGLFHNGSLRSNSWATAIFSFS
jgi:hypothetical protein